MPAIQAQTTKSTAEKIAGLSENAGTPFTAEEYLKSLAGSADEISEEQLHTVASGTWDPNIQKYLVFPICYPPLVRV